MNILRNRKGMALGTVLILASILTLLGIVIWHYSSRDVLGAERAEKKMQAYYLAKSGAEAVAQYIITNPDNIDMSQYLESLIDASESHPVKLDEDIPGHFRVKVKRDKDNNLIITSIGIVGNIKETVQVNLYPTKSVPVIDVALFANSKISMKGSSKITGDVATNAEQPGSINFTGSSIIEGNLYIGANGEINKVITGSNNSVKGEIRKLKNVRNYELPNFPDFPSDLPHRGSIKADQYHLYHDGCYSNITVNNELIVHIGDQDRIIVTDELIIKGSGKITLNRIGKGKLYLYVKNKLEIKGSSTVNNDGQPSDVILYYKGNEIDLGGSTRFVGCAYLEKANIEIVGSAGITGHIITGGNHVKITGASDVHVRAIYAPKAHVEISGSGSLKGALICTSFEAVGSCTLTFDNSIMESLPDIVESVTNGGVSYEKGLWQ